MFRKALAIYAAAFVVVAVIARAAIVGIGLPEWVFAGALVVMALGLPVVLWTGYVQRVDAPRAARRRRRYTPGGTPTATHGAIATMALKASAAHELVPHGARRHVCVRRVHRAHRAVHGACARSASGRSVAVRRGPAQRARSPAHHRLPHDQRRQHAGPSGERCGACGTVGVGGDHDRVHRPPS